MVPNHFCFHLYLNTAEIDMDNVGSNKHGKNRKGNYKKIKGDHNYIWW